MDRREFLQGTAAAAAAMALPALPAFAKEPTLTPFTSRESLLKLLVGFVKEGYKLSDIALVSEDMRLLDRAALDVANGIDTVMKREKYDFPFFYTTQWLAYFEANYRTEDRETMLRMTQEKLEADSRLSDYLDSAVQMAPRECDKVAIHIGPFLSDRYDAAYHGMFERARVMVYVEDEHLLKITRD